MVGFKSWAIALVLSFSSFVQAADYLVVFKNVPMSSNGARAYRMPTNQVFEHQLSEIKSMGAVVKTPLKNINSAVVSTNSLELLKLNKNISVIEPVVKKPLPPELVVAGLVRMKQIMNQIPLPIVFTPKEYKEAHGTPWGIKAIQASKAWVDSSAGSKARVLILDTGIDQDHPAVAYNLEKGRDFVGDGNPSATYDFADLVGHGTHVAGTIAAMRAMDGFSGVAPEAKILMGRVCDLEGCSNASVAAGLNWAIEEKVDVVNMSLGGAFSTAAERMAVERAYQAGIIVVAAAGNDGTNTVSFPAALPTVISVAAVDEDLKKAKFSQWGPELKVAAPGVEVESSVPMGTGRESEVKIVVDGQETLVKSAVFVGSYDLTQQDSNVLVNCGLGRLEDFPAVVAGKFALIKRGEIAFREKVLNAISKKATGVIIYNNEPGLIQAMISPDGSTVSIPVMMIEQSAGDAIVENMAREYTVQAKLKVLMTDYAAFSGTSMASPHVAGVAALMRSANKSLTPDQALQIITSTATPIAGYSNNELGAGLVNAQKSVREAKNLVKFRK